METSKNFGLEKINFILIALGFVVIVIGFLLMTGSTTGTEFNPDIFSVRRITIGPMISLAGFLFVIVAILYKPKSKVA
jgi:uncharacterized membrane protein